MPTIVESTVYPVFAPTPYLYEKHGDGRKQKWEIFGDAVREMMCRESGLKSCDQHFTELRAYWKFMTKQSRTYDVSTVENEKKHE